MNPFKFLAALPQPLKSLYLLFFLVFAITFVSVPLGGRDVTRWSSGALGVVAVLLGLCLLLNLNGSATAVAKHLKEAKPMGVDYSRSFLASTWYARFFGGFAVLVGVMFSVASVTGTGY